jgi:hypothetical protein
VLVALVPSPTQSSLATPWFHRHDAGAPACQRW